jgi:hypothetical protein
MKHLNYLNPNSKQSLREGILELKKAEGENDAAENISRELLRNIDEHDVIHTLFACSTDLKGEIIAHVWSLFGTTMTAEQMKKVNVHQDHKTVLSEIGHFKLLSTWFAQLPQIIKTIIRAKRMNQKFPVSEFEKYLGVSLFDLRKEFGIKLSKPEKEFGQSNGAALRNAYKLRT